jgi:hypothetical protein
MLQAAAIPVDTLTWAGRIIPKNPAEFWALVLVLVTVGLGWVALRGLSSLKLTQEDLTLTKANLELAGKDLELTRKAHELSASELELAKKDLELSKLDAQTRAQRESIALGIQQSQRMSTELFPLYAKLLKALAAASVPVFVRDGAEVSFEENEEKAKIERARAWVALLDQSTKDLTIELMNGIEGWSMFFTHRLADEKVAFEPCASGLSLMVITLYPCLLFQRRVNPTSGPFPNLVKLFKAWHGKKEMDRSLKDAARWQSSGFALLPPLGTSIDSTE